MIWNDRSDAQQNATYTYRISHLVAVFCIAIDANSISNRVNRCARKKLINSLVGWVLPYSLYPS